MTKSRAERRWQAEKHKRKAIRKLRQWDAPTTPRFVGRQAATPCSCSCQMCRNRRALEGPTLQERREACNFNHNEGV